MGRKKKVPESLGEVRETSGKESCTKTIQLKLNIDDYERIRICAVLHRMSISGFICDTVSKSVSEFFSKNSDAELARFIRGLV